MSMSTTSIKRKIAKTEIVFEDFRRGTKKVVVIGRMTKKRYIKDLLNSLGYVLKDVNSIIKVSVYEEIREMDIETFVKHSELVKK